MPDAGLRDFRLSPPEELREYSCRRGGFTLLELMVVIFIISVVLALALPTFTGMGENKLLSDAKRIASILRYLNDSALSTKESLTLRVDFKDKVIGYNGPEGEKSEQFDSLTGVELQSKGMITEGELFVFFSPLGAQENITMHLGDEDSSISVALNSMNGRVKIIQNAK
ncbi:MAG TPA: prepilin-type N-terminal cleavage/methylation domain-containing protein [Thermodesulfovibrionales bacterium]|nr:prepilin-type N-terminal cleavage/methylation domain-containing protein [Thermodesulfovibrionales bacterium]